MNQVSSIPRRLPRSGAPEPLEVSDSDFDPLAVLRLIRRHLLSIVLITLFVAGASLPAILSMEKQ